MTGTVIPFPDAPTNELLTCPCGGQWFEVTAVVLDHDRRVTGLHRRPALPRLRGIPVTGLTSTEHAAMQLTADLWNTLCQVVSDGPTRDTDLAELCRHVHAIQHAVMAQAAARAHPDRYRLLGRSITRSPNV